METATMVYRSINNEAPSYLSTLFENGTRYQKNDRRFEIRTPDNPLGNFVFTGEAVQQQM